MSTGTTGIPWNIPFPVGSDQYLLTSDLQANASQVSASLTKIKSDLDNHQHSQDEIESYTVTSPIADYSALAEGKHSVWNTTVARDSGLPDPDNGILVVEADDYQKILTWTPTVSPTTQWVNTRDASGTWSGWTRIGPEELAASLIREALLDSRRRLVKIAVVGDSISEGTGATHLLNRWQTLAQKQLRDALGIEAGPQVPYIPAHYATSAPQALVNATGDHASWDRTGLGVRTLRVGPGGEVTFSPGHVTSAQVVMFSGSSSGVAEVRVDGARVGTVDTVGSQQVLAWDVPITAGVHTISVRVAEGTTDSVYVQGLHVCDGDEESGLQLIDASHHGWAWQAETQLSSQSQAIAFKTLGIDAVVAALGTNDIVRGTPAEAMTAAVTAVSFWRTQLPRLPIMQIWMQRGGGRTETQTDPYRAALSISFNALRRAGFFDVGLVLPAHDDPGGEDLFRDSLHPNDLGHQRLAESLAGVLLAGSIEGSGMDRAPKQHFHRIEDIAGLRSELDGLWEAVNANTGA